MFDRKQFVTDADLEMSGHIHKTSGVIRACILMAPKDRGSSGRNVEGG